MSFLELPQVVHDQRQIIHVDMDAFYASVEQRQHPEYRHKALVIAYDPRKYNGHGVVTTANYEARKYGIHSAMPTFQVLDKVPADKLVFVPPNFSLYRQVSQQIHAIFNTVTPLWEPVALDEAYLDVTDQLTTPQAVVPLALKIQRTIKQQLNLTCSVGISYNKFLAKMASDYAKPFGRTVVSSQQALAFLAPLPLKKFHGIGQATQQRLAKLGMQTGADLQRVSWDFLTQKFKKTGYLLYQRGRGIDDSRVRAQRLSKSIGKEQTFYRPIFNDQTVTRILHELAAAVAQEAQTKKLRGRTVVIKVRTAANFETYTRRQTLERATNDETTIFQASSQLFTALQVTTDPLRLLGITLTNLVENRFEEISLF